MRTTTAGLILLPLLLTAACQPSTPPAPSAATPSAPTAATDDAAGPVPPETATARFRCGDLLVGAVFDNTAGEVVLGLNTVQTRLPQAVSASGARYADANGNEFWTKGDTATLTLDGQRHDCRVTEEVSAWDEARARGVVFRGLGTEPFWSLEVEGGPAPQMRLDLDMGERKLVVAQPSALPGAGGYRGNADDGSAVDLRISRDTCSDGMSDQHYPASIALKVGDQDYRGCGAFLDP